MRDVATLIHMPPKRKTETCARHGKFESLCHLGSIWTRCPACAAEKAQQAEQEQQKRLQAERVAVWQRRVNEAGIPERFRDRSLDGYEVHCDGQRQALAFARSYADGFDEALRTGRSALFVGGPGTGKTHLAAGIGLQIMRHGRSVLFTTVLRALRRIKDTWTAGSLQTESAAVESLVFPDLLILDEVGAHFGSDTERLLLFDVLNERYEKRRPMLLLSNLPLDGVKAFLGERLFDRLQEDGGEAVAFDWKSWRSGRKEFA